MKISSPAFPPTLFFHCRRAAVVVVAAWLASVCAAYAQVPELSLNEAVVSVPLPAGMSHKALVATSYRPDGAGPFPLLVLSHGSPGNGAAARAKMGRYRVLSRIREFTRRGFAVIVPMRRGYGETGGSWPERYGDCAAPDFRTAGLEAAADLLATLEYARTVPYIDGKRVILLGQSAGGFASIAAASRMPEGVLAVVNFSGGRGGNPRRNAGVPCSPEVMASTIGGFAKTIRVPVLWHYAENDQYFGPRYVQTWFDAFKATGAPGKLVMQPPFGRDGHRMFASAEGLPIWTSEFDRFLREIRFPLQ